MKLSREEKILMGNIVDSSTCAICGGPRGELGAMGGAPGYLGFYGHEESRGDTGLPAPPLQYQIVMYQAGICPDYRNLNYYRRRMKAADGSESD